MSYVNVQKTLAGAGRTPQDRFDRGRVSLRDWHRWWLARQAERRLRAELYGLNDRTLRDIGVNRSEIGSIAAYEARDASRRRRGAR